ncbi:hypothetical protein [uncultured Sphingomonas sp.]|uniref:hypothetical protein n=1 Tax=uncultured Sphingomonas sp. TaxID=158754 RepID=UPI0035C9C05A
MPRTIYHAPGGARDDARAVGAITGPEGAKTNYVIHPLGAREKVGRNYGRRPADARMLLDGYAAGLNQHTARHPGEVRLAGLFPLPRRAVHAAGA